MWTHGGPPHAEPANLMKRELKANVRLGTPRREMLENLMKRELKALNPPPELVPKSVRIS